MKVMVIVKATKDSEAGVMPDEKLLTAMGKYNEELVKAGVMLAGEGLHPSSRGKRIHISGEIRQERWTDRDSGQKRSRHVVIARETEWLDKPKGSAPTSTDEAPADNPEDEAF